MNRPFRIESLTQERDRTTFDCGVEPLNDYFQVRVGQDMRRRVTACYVAIDNATDQIAGYYTLAAFGIVITELPPDLVKKLPRYPTIPAVKVGRLAVDMNYKGKKLGGAMLFDAISRTCKSGIAAYALVVDAKDENAAAFYEHFGFQRFKDEPQTLFIPIGSALKKLAGN
ncbi:MAG: GNAT family N-acetyltransferase [Phycisphaerales bacterium]|nr:GNAT family N-acetyltransferase [Phycisphaerales bacterium]